MVTSGKVFIYFQKNSLTLLLPDLAKKLHYSSEVLDNLEILDKEKFIDLTVSFIRECNLQDQKVTVVLADDYLSGTEISLQQPEQAEEEYKAFLKTVPFDSEELVKIKLYEKDRLWVVVASKKLSQTIKEALERAGWEIEAVVPEYVFDGKLKEEEIEFEIIQKKINLLGSLNKYNFLKLPESIGERPQIRLAHTMEKRNSLWPGFTGIGVLLLVVLVVAVLIYTDIFKAPFLKKEVKSDNKVVIQPSPTVLPTPTTPAEKKKEDLKIQILNGSGISGQAGKIKKHFENLGFVNIETGNADQKENGNSIAYFGPNVTSETAGEILVELKKSLPKLEDEASPSAIVDIQIITKR